MLAKNIRTRYETSRELEINLNVYSAYYTSNSSGGSPADKIKHDYSDMMQFVLRYASEYNKRQERGMTTTM